MSVFSIAFGLVSVSAFPGWYDSAAITVWMLILAISIGVFALELWKLFKDSGETPRMCFLKITDGGIKLELTLDRISKQFQNHIAVDGFSYTMSNGVYGLLGANGAGKTTLMRMICTVLNPTSGEILFNGTSISDMGAKYCDILGYLPQNFGYYPDFSAHEFLLYMASLKGIQGRAAKHRVEELLQMVGLSDVSRQKIRSFSGGMKQRLGVAQAVLNDPKVPLCWTSRPPDLTPKSGFASAI